LSDLAVIPSLQSSPVPLKLDPGNFPHGMLVLMGWKQRWAEICCCPSANMEWNVWITDRHSGGFGFLEFAQTIGIQVLPAHASFESSGAGPNHMKTR
jgi:hypothetical protein